VPRSWVYALDDAESLMQNYDLAMEATAEWVGKRPGDWNHHVLYLKPDFQIKHGAYGMGYPQVNQQLARVDGHMRYNSDTDNSVWEPNAQGYKNHWFVRDPTGWHVTWHELAHSLQAGALSQNEGDTEAIVNWLQPYIQHVKYGLDFDIAFKMGLSGSCKPATEQCDGQYGVDDAAVHWMITENFRAGNEMDKSHSPYNEMRYQHRGMAKYADIVRLHGWETWGEFMHRENVDYQDGLDGDGDVGTNGNNLDYTAVDGLQYNQDSRTLRFSMAAGYDLTALLHFWGHQPKEPDSLKSKMQEHGLAPDPAVYCLLTRYKDTLVPMDNDEFVAFYDKIYPGCPADPDCPRPNEDDRYGRAWYDVWQPVYDESHGQAAVQQVTEILRMYYGTSDRPSSCRGIPIGAPEDGDYIVRPTSYSWMTGPSPMPSPPSPPPSIFCERFCQRAGRRLLFAATQSYTAPHAVTPDLEQRARGDRVREQCKC